jgi:hypothetical protein
MFFHGIAGFKLLAHETIAPQRGAPSKHRSGSASDMECRELGYHNFLLKLSGPGSGQSKWRLFRLNFIFSA